MVDAIFAALGGFMGGVVFTAFAFVGSNTCLHQQGHKCASCKPRRIIQSPVDGTRFRLAGCEGESNEG